MNVELGHVSDPIALQILQNINASQHTAVTFGINPRNHSYTQMPLESSHCLGLLHGKKSNTSRHIALKSVQGELVLNMNVNK